MSTEELIRALIADPPAKCPYFTLPDVSNFPDLPNVKTEPKQPYKSLVTLWGQHATRMTDENTTDFLLELLKHSKWEPDLKAVAKSWNVRSIKHM